MSIELECHLLLVLRNIDVICIRYANSPARARDAVKIYNYLPTRDLERRSANVLLRIGQPKVKTELPLFKTKVMFFVDVSECLSGLGLVYVLLLLIVRSTLRASCVQLS